jgi:hypothetical protein
MWARIGLNRPSCDLLTPFQISRAEPTFDAESMQMSFPKHWILHSFDLSKPTIAGVTSSVYFPLMEVIHEIGLCPKMSYKSFCVLER